MPDLVYFVGVLAGERSGHRLLRWPPIRESWPREPLEPSPWAGAGCPLTAYHPAHGHHLRYSHVERAAQVEGVFSHLTRDGWTLLAAWDRSADARYGCTATFAMREILAPEDALAVARRLYPELFARIEAHIGRPVVVQPWRLHA